MWKYVIVFSLLVLSLFPAASQEKVYSGNISSSTDYVEVQKGGIEGFYPRFDVESVNLTISESDQAVNSLENYRAYHFKVEGTPGISLRLILEKSEIEKWVTQNEFEMDNFVLLTDQNAVMNINTSEDRYSGNLLVPKRESVVYIAGAHNISEGYQWAVNPESTYCGLYWKPESNYNIVDNCIGELKTGVGYFGLPKNYIISAIGLIFLLIVLVLYYRKREASEYGDIETITEQITEEMRTGDIPMDKELLLKLEQANEKAYNNQYEEASKLLAEVKSELDSEIKIDTN
ncbi:MAG: hypothetical protein V5A72_01125 [Candidatus Nanohaloarchaea archaeon]